MTDATGVVLGIFMTAAPFYLSLILFKIGVLKRHAQLFLALAVGFSFYFLVDGWVDSTELGVTQGYYGGWQPLELILAFAITFIVLASLRRKPEYSWPLWVVALGIAIHSFAEANDIASSANLYLTNLSAVLPSAVSFVLHKFLEGTVLVAAAIVIETRGLKQVALAGTPMLIIAIIGSLSALFSLTLSPVIAAGVGGWMVVTVMVASHIGRPSRPIVLALVAVGFVVVYAATLLHFTGSVVGG